MGELWSIPLRAKLQSLNYKKKSIKKSNLIEFFKSKIMVFNYMKPLDYLYILLSLNYKF